MKFEIEIPDTPELNRVPSDDIAAVLEMAVRGQHWYEYAGVELDFTSARVAVLERVWTNRPKAPFKEWLLTQKHRNDAVGDLAKDVADDHFGPGASATKQQWREHLGNQSHIVSALEQAWEEFPHS